MSKHEDDARELAELILSMGIVTAAGQYARHLARKVLGIPTPLHDGSDEVTITTNGTTRFIPRDEPVFLLRGQDQFAADTVRYWADRVLLDGEGDIDDIQTSARDHADKMDAWPKKKTPDLPGSRPASYGGHVR